LNETLADKPSSADENSQADQTDDSQLSESPESSDNDTPESEETSQPQSEEVGAEASEESEVSEASEASEVSEASEASEAGEASEASEASEDAEAAGAGQQDEGQPDEAQQNEGQQDEAQQGDSEQPAAEEASADEEELEGLFLSPDDDSDDVIEVDYSEETAGGGMEVRQEDVSELHDQIARLEEKVEEAERERGEFKERWVRAAADLENLRKRAKREKEEQRKYGNDKLALELLPAVDNLERALAHAEKSDDTGSIVDGVKMVYRQILTAFEKHGITGFESKGEKFNPEQHEAIQQVETTEHDTGTVVEQYQKGYFIHDRLLRPAMVSVAKRVAGGDNDQQSEASEASDSSEATDAGTTDADE
jgi:molecular chaperone GrpE